MTEAVVSSLQTPLGIRLQRSLAYAARQQAVVARDGKRTTDVDSLEVLLIIFDPVTVLPLYTANFVLANMKRDKKDEEAGAANPYANLDKTAVLQEARAFNETPINAKKCRLIISKICYMLQQGENIGRTEATECFFAVTKLFQSKDGALRRLVYLAINDLCKLADDVIIVTSSLTKDMTGREELYRAPAIRSLCRITDSGMLQAIERYMKQAIVDKSAAVASAALVSSVHLLKQSPEVIRRWANEIQEAVSHDNPMVQYHALVLLYHIRSTDRLAVNKLVQKYSKSGLRSPLALCYLIRIASKLIAEDDSGSDHPLYGFINSCLCNRSEMVVYEAASALVNLPKTSGSDLSTAVSTLQSYLSSPKPSLRFAAVRTLNKISTTHPEVVINCNVDLETLITDQNRSIATLAITTLLKTGGESSVERLMKQISSFVSEISDEFKIVVIEAIQSLCVRYPRKHATMMNFLSKMLRDDGGFEFKRAIVNTIITIIEENTDAKEYGLMHLCEFIEDCEHSALAAKVLHLLGKEASSTSNPQRYIRYIYNRVILEKTRVRAAAVTALAKLGASCPQLRPSIEVLLSRCKLDNDDEVRDRATYYLSALRSEQQNVIASYVSNNLQVSVQGLERCLESYVHGNDFSKPFDLKQVPVSSLPITAAAERKRPSLAVDAAGAAPSAIAAKNEEKKASRQDIYAEQLAAIPQFSRVGPLFKSSSPVELTEAETEYSVTCIKHTFANHVVLQFDCCNTLNDQLLENVTVELEPADDAAWTIEATIPLAALPYSVKGTTYILLGMPEDGGISGSFNTTLKFQVKDVDPTTGEPESDEYYDDIYALEELDITVGDHIQPYSKANFSAAWDQMGTENEVDETFSLTNQSSLPEAVKNLIKCLGLGPCERSDRVPEGKSAHTVLLAGKFRDGTEILARVRLALDPQDQTVNMNLIVRSEDNEVSQLIASLL
uniref:Coatomer subunit gamma n=1 Tax=Steinernema glaseri TaxID=37863 RepID=A0A1I7XYF9_9BILA